MEVRRASKEDRKYCRTSVKSISAQDIQGPNPLEKDCPFYPQLHDEIARNVKDFSPRPSKTLLKQRMDSKMVAGDGELVKYMSKLPGYLERGEKDPQENVLNVGVLDWGRLEKWRHSHKHIPKKNINTLPSVSGANISSSLPNDESSARSSTVKTRSSAHQRIHRQSLQCHLMTSHIGGHAEVVSSSAEGVREFRDHKIVQKNKPSKHFVRDPSAIKLEGHSKGESKFRMALGDKTLLNGVNCEVSSGIRMKVKTLSDELATDEEKLEERIIQDHDQEVGQKLPGVSKVSESTELVGRRETATGLKSFQERSKNGYHAEVVDIDFPRLCPFPCKFEGARNFQLKGKSSSMDVNRHNLSSERSHSAPRSTKACISPSRGGNLEDKRPPLSSAKLICASEKGRNISPFRRLSFSMSKTSKSSYARDGPDLPQLDTMNISTQHGLENAANSSCVDGSTCIKPSAKNKARSSPLRRLLEPMMAATHSCNLPEPSQKETTSYRAHRLSDGKPYPSTVHLGRNKKHGTSTAQAVLRVTVKNNQPLFTFAVEKENYILAATLKKLGTSEDDDCSCIYTFFRFQEVKKKNGMWINQRGKAQGHDYVSNYVAQMRVSGSSPSKSRMNQCSIREFVLFSLDMEHTDKQTSDMQPSNELAAIVIKVPSRTNASSTRNVCQNEKYNGNSEDENCSVLCRQDISATVILQSGVHSLPHNGGPSSLIQRWKSGGSCDCGGWDVGCNLRVLVNQYQLNKNSKSPKAASCISNQLELFFLGGEQDVQPFFTFIPLKDGIYSVEYNSSLSLLQAFSICIAIAESRKLLELSESKY